MTDALMLALTAFVFFFSLHAVWTAHGSLDTYLKGQDYFLGFAYSLSLAFAVYAFTQLRRGGRRAAIGAAGGIGLGAFLLAAGCFLVGCCGSPMLAVWISLLGAKAFGFAKPIVAAVTTLSVIGGILWLRRGCGASCHCAAAPGEEEGESDECHEAD